MDDGPVQIVVARVHHDGTSFEHEPRHRQVVARHDHVQGRAAGAGHAVHAGARVHQAPGHRVVPPVQRGQQRRPGIAVQRVSGRAGLEQRPRGVFVAPPGGQVQCRLLVARPPVEQLQWRSAAGAVALLLQHRRQRARGVLVVHGEVQTRPPAARVRRRRRQY